LRFLPTRADSGAGALGRQVMGFVVIGGMLAASFIAVFLIPVLFYLVEKLMGKKRKATEPTKPPRDPACGDDKLKPAPVPVG
jgi:HAE1 family hydrophobic/amphiphilic exporter-1